MSDYQDPDVLALQQIKSQLQPAPPANKRTPAATPASSGDTDLDQLRAIRAQVRLPDAQKAPAPGLMATTASRGFLGNAADAVTAAAHHVGNAAHGAAQFIENGIGAGVHWAAPGTGVDRYLQKTIASDNAYLRNREASYQAKTPDSLGAYTGAAIGEVAPWIAGGAARAVGAVGDVGAAAVSKLGKLWEPLGGGLSQAAGRGVTQGAVIGGISPVSDGGDYWKQKGAQAGTGAAIGGGAPLAGKLAVGLMNQTKGLVAPWTNPESLVGPLLEKVSGLPPAQLADALNNYKTIVPGSVPTTAQILKTPSAVLTEKTFANTGAGKVAMAERQAANNAARLNLLQQHAGDPADLQAAIAHRSTEAAPFLDTLKAAPPVDASPILNHLDSITKSNLGTDPVIRGAVADARNLLSNHSTAGQNGEALTSPDILDGIRQNMRGYLAKYASNGAVSSRQEAALGPLKNTIVDTIDTGVPGYRDYLASYAENSVPINTMEQLQKFATALDSRASDSTGNSLLSLTHARQLAAQLDRSKTGISPEASAAVDSILADLQRESVSNSVRAGSGSDTALNLQAPSWLSGQIYGNSFGGTPGPVARGIGAGIGWLAGQTVDQGLAGAGAGAMAASKISQFGSSKVNEALARALMDPEEAAAIAQQRIGGPASPYTAKLAEALRKAPILTPYVDQLQLPAGP
ncbi:hypothetical protein ACFFKC_09940 [Pseudoduganella danionis]|uniref:Uncharacterized protein n=1 Tax=Pseudoduganella danionis TaxID=1890295 RepID=A0ABW9SL80_9BURK|nr:hypothetical protein [Pseudoduganella danionis]MTW32655.1 hypothetical protein [Pseudoduganella danionis]